MIPHSATLNRADRSGEPVAAVSLDTPRARRWRGWLDRLAGGDLDACAAFYDESAELAFTLLMQRLGDRDAAEDALVDLYLDVRRRAASGEHRGRHPVAWLVSLVGAASSRALPHGARVVAFERIG